MGGESVLSTYLDALGWSPERLAREINRLQGPGTISLKAPYGWVRGAYPRGRLPGLVAAVLSDQLGKSVEVSQVWPPRKSAPDDDHPGWESFRQSVVDGAAVDQLGDCSCNEGTDGVPLSGESLIAAAVDWLGPGQETLHPQRGGVEITPAVVDAVRQRTTQLRQLDDAHGARLVLGWSAHELSWALGLAREATYSRQTGLCLQQAIAELAQLAGWLACDVGQLSRGQRYLLTGLRAARLAGDPSLGAYIVSCLAYHATWHGDATSGLRLIAVARAGLGQPAPGPVLSLLSTRQARAHARLGQQHACQQALNQAHESFLDTGVRVPSWSYWVSSAVLEADAGRAWLDLGRADRARDSLYRGLREFGEHQPRNRLLHHTSLAEAHLALRQVDGAAEATRAALALADPTVDSDRVRDRLRTVAAGFRSYDARRARQAADDVDVVLSQGHLHDG